MYVWRNAAESEKRPWERWKTKATRCTLHTETHCFEALNASEVILNEMSFKKKSMLSLPLGKCHTQKTCECGKKWQKNRKLHQMHCKLLTYLSSFLFKYFANRRFWHAELSGNQKSIQRFKAIVFAVIFKLPVEKWIRRVINYHEIVVQLQNERN